MKFVHPDPLTVSKSYHCHDQPPDWARDTILAGLPGLLPQYTRRIYLQISIQGNKKATRHWMLSIQYVLATYIYTQNVH